MKFIKLHNLSNKELWLRVDLIYFLQWEEERKENIDGNFMYCTPAHTQILISGQKDVLMAKETPEEILKLINND